MELLDRLRPLSYFGSDVMIIPFSVANRESFLRVKERWKSEGTIYFVKYGNALSVTHYVPGTPFIVVGNKIDLRNDEETVKKLADKNLTMVTYEEGLQLAKEVGAAAYRETSALTGEGIKELFNTAIDIVMNPPPRPAKK